MNVLTLLAMTFAIAFVAPVARYAYQKLVDCLNRPLLQSRELKLLRAPKKTLTLVSNYRRF